MRTLTSFPLLTAALFAVLATAPASAEDTPRDACLQRASDLAQKAETKELPPGSHDKLDNLFSLMEKHCQALELPQANTVADDINRLLDTAK